MIEKKNLKIMCVAPLDLRKSGAGVTHFVEVCSNLKKNGHDVLAICPGYPGYRQLQFPFTVKFVPTIKKSYLSFLLFEIFLFVLWPLLILWFRPDVIYVRHTANIVLPLFWRAVIHRQLVLEENGVVLEELKTYGLPNVLISLIYLVRRCHYRLADQVVCVSNGVKNGVLKHYNISEEKLSVIENGVNTDLFRPLDRLKARYELGWSDCPIVGFVGSFAPWHGLNDLVDSAIIISKQKPDYKLLFVLAGYGPLFDATKKRVKDHGLEDYFLFPGWVDYEIVPTYINSFDLSVMPFTGSGSPLKFLEYLACGTPLVASQNDGTARLDDIPASLTLVPATDSDQLAEAILRCLEMPRHDNSTEIWAYVDKHFSWRVVAIKLVDLFYQHETRTR